MGFQRVGECAPGGGTTRQRWEEKVAKRVFRFAFNAMSSSSSSSSSSASPSPRRKQRKAMASSSMYNRVQRHTASETYFSRTLKSLSTTSSTPFTSAHLVTPSISLTAAKTRTNTHVEEKRRLYHLHRRGFGQWRFEMSCGFHLLLFGYGSKKAIAEEFCTTMWNDRPVVIVNGFHEGITLGQVVDLIISVGRKPMTGISPLKRIEKFLALVDSTPKLEFILLVHNIDAPVFRTETAVTLLAMLARHPQIGMIATCDHIHTHLLWDATHLGDFNWVHHDVTTFAEYTDEVASQGNKATGHVATVEAAARVLPSLTTNARTVFKILVQHHLDPASGTSSEGLRYGEYFEACRNAFAVSNDATFRLQMVEFRDHALVQTRRLVDGSEMFYIPMSEPDLCKLLSLL